jgi:hypothetical protein
MNVAVNGTLKPAHINTGGTHQDYKEPASRDLINAGGRRGVNGSAFVPSKHERSASPRPLSPRDNTPIVIDGTVQDKQSLLAGRIKPASPRFSIDEDTKVPLDLNKKQDDRKHEADNYPAVLAPIGTEQLPAVGPPISKILPSQGGPVGSPSQRPTPKSTMSSPIIPVIPSSTIANPLVPSAPTAQPALGNPMAALGAKVVQVTPKVPELDFNSLPDHKKRELERAAALQASKTYEVKLIAGKPVIGQIPSYQHFTAEEKSVVRTIFKMKFTDLARKSPSIAVAMPSDDQPLEEWWCIYERCFRRFRGEMMASDYKQYMKLGFAVIELGLTYLGFGDYVQGLTAEHQAQMDSYELLLIQIGEENFSPFGSGNPMFSLAIKMALNTLLFVFLRFMMTRGISIDAARTATGIARNLGNAIMNNPNAINVTTPGVTAAPGAATPAPAMPSLNIGGFDIGGLIGGLFNRPAAPAVASNTPLPTANSKILPPSIAE